MSTVADSPDARDLPSNPLGWLALDGWVANPGDKSAPGGKSALGGCAALGWLALDGWAGWLAGFAIKSAWLAKLRFLTFKRLARSNMLTHSLGDNPTSWSGTS